MHERRHRHELGIVVEHLVVDLIAHHDEAALLRKTRDRRQHRPRVDGAGGVVGVHDDDRAGPGRHQCLDLGGVRYEAVLGSAGIVDRTTAIEVHGGRPQRVIRTRYEHLVAVVEQRTQREVDEFADAVADEDLLGADAGDTARLLLHHHCLAGGEDAFLVAISFALREVLDHGEPHRLRRAEPEQCGVADVERDDLVTLAGEFLSATGEFAADLIANIAQAVAGADRCIGVVHGRIPKSDARRTGSPQG